MVKCHTANSRFEMSHKVGLSDRKQELDETEFFFLEKFDFVSMMDCLLYCQSGYKVEWTFFYDGFASFV
jgi:hypothetical protein